MKIRFRLPAAATVLAIAYGAIAAGPAPSETSAEIAAVKARIEQLESQQAQDEKRRHKAEARLEDKITRDALAESARVQDEQLFLTAGGFTGGFTNDRFVLQSDDGNFVLRPWVQLQFRDVTIDRVDFQGGKKHSYDEVDNGFEVRQVRVGVDGNIFLPDFSYTFNWATQRTSANTTVKGASGSTTPTVSNSLGGVPCLQQAWVRYHIPSSPFFLRAGQIKDPIHHDQIIDTRYQQCAERSLTADIFINSDAFAEGATLIYDPDTFIRAEGGVNHGMRSANTNFLSYPNNGGFNQFDYGLVGRFEYKVMGRWKDYGQVGAVDTREPLLVFGSGADYSERGRDGQVVVAADAMYADQHGLSLYGAFVDRYTTHNFGYYQPSATGANIIAGNPAVAGRATNEYAIVMQAGYIFFQHLEPFGRYEFIHLEGTPAGSQNWVQAITTGANYYFYGHRLKLTGEVIWLPDGLPFDDSPNDVLTNSNGKAELSFVAQLQLLL